MGNCLSANPQELAYEAIASGDLDKLEKLLSGKGGNRLRVNEKNAARGGYTLLSLAAEAGNTKILKMLLEKGRANPDLPNDAGFVPLTLALKGGHDGCATVLVHAGANTECADAANGRTALLWAVDKGSATTVKLLAEKGADLEAKDRRGLTALMMAADKNNADIVRVLLQAGANPRSQDLKAGTALSRAKEKHHTLVVQLLETALKEASSKGSTADSSEGSGKGGAAAGKGKAGAAAAGSGRGPLSSSSPAAKGGDSGAKGGVVRKHNPLAGKGALGSRVEDTFSSGGRASALVSDTKERTKNVSYKAVSLDAALNSSPGGK